MQKPQLKRNSNRQSPYWDDRATPPWKASNVSNGSGMQGPPPAGVKIMKKAGKGKQKTCERANWFNMVYLKITKRLKREEIEFDE